jgi:SOS-response transcriptional repressor LexA
MSAKSFTERQGQYLAFIDAYTRVHGRPPAEIDMQRHFRVSPPSVHQMVLTLEHLGLVRRQPGVARSIEVLLAPEDLPVLRHPEPVKSSVPRNWWVICYEVCHIGDVTGCEVADVETTKGAAARVER